MELRNVPSTAILEEHLTTCVYKAYYHFWDITRAKSVHQARTYDCTRGVNQLIAEATTSHSSPHTLLSIRRFLITFLRRTKWSYLSRCSHSTWNRSKGQLWEVLTWAERLPHKDLGQAQKLAFLLGRLTWKAMARINMVRLTIGVT